MGAAGDDVERFFHHLARTLAEEHPDRLRRAIPLAEIHQSIVPYRTHRRALGLASSDEYETVLLRLCAGEGDLVRVEPDAVRDRFAREAASAHPDLDILHQHGEVTVTLARDAVVQSLSADTVPSAASPALPYFAEPQAEPLPGSAEPAFQPILADMGDANLGDANLGDAAGSTAGSPVAAEPEAVDQEPPSCAFCGGLFPTGRPVQFCPHCGQSVATPRCRVCIEKLEPAWRHCVNCGAAVRSP